MKILAVSFAAIALLATPVAAQQAMPAPQFLTQEAAREAAVQQQNVIIERARVEELRAKVADLEKQLIEAKKAASPDEPK